MNASKLAGLIIISFAIAAALATVVVALSNNVPLSSVLPG